MRLTIILFLLFLSSLTIASGINDNPNLNKPYAKLKALPVGAVSPEGWLKEFLERQKNGLTGHLEVGGFPYNTTLWMPPYNNEKNEPWWRFEQSAYWIDGMARCGYLLNDTMLINRAEEQINYVFDNPASNGYLGPDLGKDNKILRWVHTVFFRAAIAKFEKTNDYKIIEGLRKHYLGERYAHNKQREMTNIEAILYCYDKTRDTALLNFAKQIYSAWEKTDTTDASPKKFLIDEPINVHGVTYNEEAKLGALMFMYTGEEKYLTESKSAYSRVLKYHMLADGMHSCTEKFQPVLPLESHEACDITDFTWSLEYMIMATGNSKYADITEKVIFNALPGQVLNDFKALQYFSCPNQVIATSLSNHNFFHKGSTSMRYSPNPWTQCCAGNINRAMPNYVINMWMTDQNGNPAAVLYAPSSLKYNLPSGEGIEIQQITNYPFDDSITFKMKVSQKKEFRFYFRIPEWMEKYQITVNGKPVDPVLKDGFAAIDREWETGDDVILKFEQKIKKMNWGTNGVSIERGPIVYALNVKGNRQINSEDKGSSEKFPAYEIFPASDWNYGLALKNIDVSKLKTVIANMNYPWSDSDFPVRIQVPAVKIDSWKIKKVTEVPQELKKDSSAQARWTKELKEKGFVEMTPQLPEEEELKTINGNNVENIELVPYGCTKLRITVFANITN